RSRSSTSSWPSRATTADTPSGHCERKSPRKKRGHVDRLYDEAVRQALTVLWEAADRVCGKRLKALIPTLVDAMERHGHLDLDPIIKTKVLQVSAATIDRVLADARSHIDGQRKRRSGVGAARDVRQQGAAANPAAPGQGMAQRARHGNGLGRSAQVRCNAGRSLKQQRAKLRGRRGP